MGYYKVKPKVSLKVPKPKKRKGPPKKIFENPFALYVGELNKISKRLGTPSGRNVKSTYFNRMMGKGHLFNTKAYMDIVKN